MREWRAKGVSFLSVCCVSRLLLFYVFTVGMFTVGILTVDMLTVGMCTVGLFTVGVFTVGLVLFVLIGGPPHFSAVATTCVPFWCHILAFMFEWLPFGLHVRTVFHYVGFTCSSIVFALTIYLGKDVDLNFNDLLIPFPFAHATC